MLIDDTCHFIEVEIRTIVVNVITGKWLLIPEMPTRLYKDVEKTEGFEPSLCWFVAN